jgi:hypothetical protein
VYSNSDESGIPFERPTEFEGRRIEDVTQEGRRRFRRPGGTRRLSVPSACPKNRTRSCSGGDAPVKTAALACSTRRTANPR